VSEDTLVEKLESDYQLRRGNSQECNLRIAANRKAWFDVLRNQSPTLQSFLERVLQIENKLPLQEALAFLQTLAQLGYLRGLSSWAEIPEDENPELLAKTDPQTIVAELRKIDFFKDFSAQALLMLAEKAILNEVAPGSYIVHQGDEARDFFVLLRGSVSVYVKRRNGVRSRVCVLREGTIFGEGSFEGNRVRGADVFAKECVQLLSVSAVLFEECLKLHVDDSIRPFLTERILVSQFLSTAPLFRSLPQEALGLFIKEGSLIRVKKDDVLFRQGEKGDTFFLVIRGQVAVYRDNNAPVFLSQGDCFGEIALLKGIPRTATVKAFEESLLMSISAQSFLKILFSNLGMALMLEDVAEKRIKGEHLTLT
jgi:CRP-like cAMP-binding protein